MVKPLIKVGLMVSTVIGLQSCATLSKDECHSADWRTIGFEDGSRGYSSQRIASHREACAEYGVTPNLELYLTGHRQGVRNYCVPSRGFSLGRSGSQYNNLCPADLEPDFLASYRQGQEIHAIEQEIRNIDRDMNAVDKERSDLIIEIEKNEKMIVANSTSPKLRRELLEQNKKLEQLILEKDDEFHRLESQKNYLERQVGRLLRNRS